MRKVHIMSEQFDGARHAWCGRGNTAVPPDEFEATPARIRCAYCDRDYFPRGQPDWHFNAAVERLEVERRMTRSG